MTKKNNRGNWNSNMLKGCEETKEKINVKNIPWLLHFFFLSASTLFRHINISIFFFASFFHSNNLDWITFKHFPLSLLLTCPFAVLSPLQHMLIQCRQKRRYTKKRSNIILFTKYKGRIVVLISRYVVAQTTAYFRKKNLISCPIFYTDQYYYLISQIYFAVVG